MATNPSFGQETTAEEVAAFFSASIVGKTVLITGVNPNGLGAAAAVALAKQGPAKLIMTARTPSKAAPVLDLLRRENPASTTTFEFVRLDLSSFASVRAAASTIRSLAPAIDILIANAGVMALPERTLSTDGVEMHLATNFLGHFLLTKELLPQLRATNSARVVNITSAGFVLTGFRFSDYNFDGEKSLPKEEQVNVSVAAAMGYHEIDPSTSYLPMVAYAQANVANMLFAHGLCDRYGKEGLLSFSAAPGVAVTELQRHLPKDFRNPYMFYKTPSQGVASFLVAALDPALSDHAGAYINDCQVESTAEHVESPALATRLWDLAEDLVNQQ